MKHFFTLLCAILISTLAFPQDESQGIAPSLQVGLSGIKFNKGILDEELIASLIAKKQNEVKIKVVKDMLLSTLRNSGETYYAFTDNTINTVLLETDESVRLRNLMENSVNFAFVHGLALYILEMDAAQPLSIQLERVAKLDAIQVNGNQAVTPDLFNKDSLTKKANEVYEFYQKEEFTRETSETAGKNKTQLKENEDLGRTHGVLIDLCFEVVRNNERLKQQGLFRTNYTTDYRAMNLYTEALANPKLKTELQALKLAVETELNSLLDFAGFLRVMDRENHVIACSDITKNALDVELKGLLDGLSGDLKKAHAEIVKAGRTKEHAKAVKEILRNERLVREFYNETDNKSLSNALFILQHNLAPEYEHLLLTDESMQTSYGNILSAISKLECYLSNVSDYDNLVSKHRLFFSLIGGIYGYDETRTYVDYLNLLSDIGSIIPDKTAGNTINKITSFIRRYVKIVEDEEGETLLDVDVQGFLLSIKEIKPKKFRPVNFLFSVGATSALFVAPTKAAYFTNENNGTFAQNFTFMAEKIGFKFKIYDFDYEKSFNRGETYRIWFWDFKRLAPPSNPTVSDIFFNFYGSGLLYGLAGVTTVTDFNDPIFGIDFGLTFFNGLEACIAGGIPISPSRNAIQNISASYVGLNFSIRFEEYIKALDERVKANKTTKVLQKASMANNGSTKKTKDNQ